MSSFPPPLPVSPLGYDMAGGMQRGRPGIITAVGVMSIVVACLSGIFSLLGVVYAFGMFMVSKVPVPIPTTIPSPPGLVASTAPAAAPAAGAAGGTDDGSTRTDGVVTIGGVEMTAAESDEGLSGEQRQVVITTLTRMSGLNDGRQKHLDLLLSVAGKKVMPVAASPAITMQKIRANVTDYGILPSAAGDGRGPTYFLVGAGRLECYDDHAVFRPDGSTDVVSASASAAAVDDGSGAASSASPQAAGNRARIRGGRTTAPFPPFKTMSFQINPLATVGTILGELASVALAIYLLVIGVLVLRDVRGGRMLHWWYVGLKIPVVLVTAVAWWIVSRDLSSSLSAFFAANPMPGMSPAAPKPPFGAIGSVMASWLTVAAVIALAYPIALAIVLNSRTARDYYGSVRYG
jgi:hypothetical protein